MTIDLKTVQEITPAFFEKVKAEAADNEPAALFMLAYRLYQEVWRDTNFPSVRSDMEKRIQILTSQIARRENSELTWNDRGGITTTVEGPYGPSAGPSAPSAPTTAVTISQTSGPTTLRYDLRYPIDFKSTTPDEVVKYANAPYNDPSAMYVGCIALDSICDFLPREESALALDWAFAGIEVGDFLCEARYGLMRMAGHGLRQDIDVGLPHVERAKDWIIENAAQRHAQAMTLLGTMYEMGAAVPRNATEAIKWYEAAIELGEPFAKYNRAQTLLSNERGIKQDPVRGRALLTETAEYGIDDAQIALAKLCVTLRDWDEAAKWFGKSIEKQSALACVLFGDMLLRNEKDKPADRTRAFELHRQAEARDSLDGIKRMADHYTTGLKDVVQPSMAETYHRLGTLLLRNGDTIETMGLDTAQVPSFLRKWGLLDRRAKVVTDDEGLWLKFTDNTMLEIFDDSLEQRKILQKGTLIESIGQALKSPIIQQAIKSSRVPKPR